MKVALERSIAEVQEVVRVGEEKAYALGKSWADGVCDNRLRTQRASYERQIGHIRDEARSSETFTFWAGIFCGACVVACLWIIK